MKNIIGYVLSTIGHLFYLNFFREDSGLYEEVDEFKQNTERALKKYIWARSVTYIGIVLTALPMTLYLCRITESTFWLVLPTLLGFLLIAYGYYTLLDEKLCELVTEWKPFRDLLKKYASLASWAPNFLPSDSLFAKRTAVAEYLCEVVSELAKSIIDKEFFLRRPGLSEDAILKAEKEHKLLREDLDLFRALVKELGLRMVSNADVFEYRHVESIVYVPTKK